MCLRIIERWSQETLRLLQLRVGIATGPVVIGDLGDGAAGCGGEHGEVDDVPADNRAIVDGSREPLLNGANVATQQLHGFGLSRKPLHEPILEPSAACFDNVEYLSHFQV